MTFGERLKDLRERANISQRYLANQIGTSQTVISNYERDITKPKFEHIVPLAKTLHVSTDYLFELDDLPGSDKWILKFLYKLKSRTLESNSFSQQLYAWCIGYIINEIERELNKSNK